MEISETVLSNEMWDFVWHTFANASLTYDLVSSQNGTKGNNDDANFPLENPAKLGILTGFLIACLADFRIATPKLDVCLDSKLKTMSITVLNLTIFLLLAPIISTILTVLFVYRKIVELTLRIKLKDEFVGLLEGTDCVWALEESTALSVINVLAIIEKNDATTNENFLLDFRTLIEKCLSTSSFDKLNWIREKSYGYHYWRKSEKISIEERVRWFEEDDEEHEKCDGSCDEVDGDFLNNILTRATNKQLPKDHSTSWEILVGRNCTKTSSKRLEKMEEGLSGFGEKSIEGKSTIPVLFRVHHCLGDGVALLRLMLESIADSTSPAIVKDLPPSDSEKKLRISLPRDNSSILKIVEREKEIFCSEKYLLSASMPFTMRIPLRKIAKAIVNHVDDQWQILKSLIDANPKEHIVKILESSWRSFEVKFLERARKRLRIVLKISSTIISIPNCLLQQAIRSMDNSALHGPTLSGEKLLSCWMETESNNPRSPNLLAKIRDIKSATGSRFGDVVLAVLSENLHRYFSKIGEAAPKTLTVVIPARMTVPSKKLTLQNEFSVGLLSLCCSEVNGESSSNVITEDARLFERVGDVARSSEILRNAPDYLINFWVMKWLSAALPECLLRPVLQSHSTLVFSNLPGPREVSIIGNTLRNVAFWIPHRGATGLGCSLLTYGGKVHLSIMADTSLISSQRLLDEIIRNTVADIEKLHDSISLSCLAINI